MEWPHLQMSPLHPPWVDGSLLLDPWQRIVCRTTLVLGKVQPGSNFLLDKKPKMPPPSTLRKMANRVVLLFPSLPTLLLQESLPGPPLSRRTTIPREPMSPRRSPRRPPKSLKVLRTPTRTESLAALALWVNTRSLLPESLLRQVENTRIKEPTRWESASRMQPRKPKGNTLEGCVLSPPRTTLIPLGTVLLGTFPCI